MTKKKWIYLAIGVVTLLLAISLIVYFTVFYRRATATIRIEQEGKFVYENEEVKYK